MRLASLHRAVEAYLEAHQLQAKFEKQKRLFEENPRHPSLHTEILEPRHWRIYSFRLDNRYRAIFRIRTDGTAEIIDVNDHYQ